MLALPLSDHVVREIRGRLVDGCVAVGAEQDQVVVRALVRPSHRRISARTLSAGRDDVGNLREVNVFRARIDEQSISAFRALAVSA